MKNVTQALQENRTKLQASNLKSIKGGTQSNALVGDPVTVRTTTQEGG